MSTAATPTKSNLGIGNRGNVHQVCPRRCTDLFCLFRPIGMNPITIRFAGLRCVGDPPHGGTAVRHAGSAVQQLLTVTTTVSLWRAARFPPLYSGNIAEPDRAPRALRRRGSCGVRTRRVCVDVAPPTPHPSSIAGVVCTAARAPSYHDPP